MSTTRRPGTADPDALAERFASASLVKLVPRAGGDAIAAAGTIARALRERGVPFQISPARTRTERRQRLDGGEEQLAVAVGELDGADASIGVGDRPESALAAEIARRLDATVAPELPLAGIVAAGDAPGGADELFGRAVDRGLTRRPGVAIPTDDPVDGLAHSTLLHGPFSGDRERAESTVASIGDDSDRRALASLCAIDATATDTPERAAEYIGRAVHPYATPEAPFATLGGYADVLDTVARTNPGTAVAIAIGADVRDAALESWRRQATAVHETIDAADPARYDGLLAVQADVAPVGTVARLVSAVASPEPIVVVLGDREVGIATGEGIDASEPTAAVRDAVDGDADWSRKWGLVVADRPVDDRAVVETTLEVA